MDEHVDYAGMYDADSETEELVSVEPVEDIVEDLDTIDEIVDEVAGSSAASYVMADVPSVAKLRVRESSSGEGTVLKAVPGGTLLLVINDSDSEWVFVETIGDASPVRGYVKKAFVVDAPAPTSSSDE